MSDNILWLKGCAGIGNRLYTLSSAIEYAMRTNRILFIDWSDGQFSQKGVNSFFDAFSLNDIDFITDINEVKDLKTSDIYPLAWQGNLNKGIYELYELVSPKVSFQSRVLSKLLPKIYGVKLHGYWAPKVKPPNDSFFPEWLRAYNVPLGNHIPYNLTQRVVVFSDFSPLFNPCFFKRHVKIKPIFLAKAKQYLKLYNNKSRVVGLHVRNTDKKPTKSIDNLIDYLSKYYVEGTVILLCTDNPETESYFKNRLSNVITCEKSSLRDSELPPHRLSYENENVDKRPMYYDSLVDMCLLAECDELIYQGNSSFSMIALALRDSTKKSIDWLQNLEM